MAGGGAAAAAVRASESERGGVDERKWKRRERRVRSGAPGGRLGRVHPGAWAPRGGRALPARHGGTAWPAIARGLGAGAGKGKARSRAGPASASGPEARLRPASTPFPFFYFLNIFQAHFDSFKIFFRFGP